MSAKLALCQKTLKNNKYSHKMHMKYYSKIPNNYKIHMSGTLINNTRK